MSTSLPLRVNGLQIVAHDAPSRSGFGPFSGIQIMKQSAPPPHYGNGGILWSDGDVLHWSTADGRDVALPRVDGSQLLAVDDVNGVLHSQFEGEVVAGIVGGAEVLTLLLVVRFGQWILRKAELSAWIARQPKKHETPYRGDS